MDRRIQLRFIHHPSFFLPPQIASGGALSKHHHLSCEELTCSCFRFHTAERQRHTDGLLFSVIIHSDILHHVLSLTKMQLHTPGLAMTTFFLNFPGCFLSPLFIQILFMVVWALLNNDYARSAQRWRHADVRGEAEKVTWDGDMEVNKGHRPHPAAFQHAGLRRN